MTARARAGLAAWAMSLCTAAVPALAADTGWPEHCTNVKPPTQTRPADAEGLRRNAPAEAMRQACARLRQGPAGFDALLDLAQALIASDKNEAATRLLAQLETGADAAGSARIALSTGRLARMEGKYEQADTAYSRALAVLRAQAQPAAPALAWALIGRAGAITALNKAEGLDKAEALLDEAQTLLEHKGETLSYAYADVAYQRTMLAYARDDWDTTLRMARRERDIIQRIDGPDAAAQLDALATQVALIASRRDYDETMRIVAEGRRLARLAPGASRHAYLGILNTESVVLLDLGRPTQGLAVAEEALAIAVQGWGVGSTPTLTPLDRRSRAEEALQRHAQARRSHAEILALLQSLGPQVAIARRLRLLDTTAGFHMRMNDLDTAQRLADQGLALTPADGTLKYWRGRFLRRAGMLAAAEGRWAEAAELHGRSLALMQPALNAANPYVTGSQAMRCEAQVRAGLETSACQAAEARLETLKHAAPSERVLVRRALALRATQAGQRREAHEHELHALAAAQSSESQGQLWRVLGSVALGLREAGARELPVLLAKAAVERIEAVREQLAGTPTALDLEPDYLADKYALYRRTADWLAADGRADEALALIGLLKGEEFSDFVRGRSDAPQARASGVPWRDAERQWLASSPLAAPVAERGFSRHSMEQIAALESARKAAWQQALQLPVPVSASTQAFDAGPPPAPADLVATLFLGEHHLNLHLRWATGQELIRRPVDPRELGRNLGLLLARIERRENAQALLQTFYQGLAAPIDQRARAVHARRLLLRLDGDLRYLPFAALHDGHGYLVERYSIVQIAHANDPTKLNVNGSAASPATRIRPAWLQAFGSAQVAGLRGVRDELCGIVHGEIIGGAHAGPACPGGVPRGALPGKAWLDQAFTSAQLRQALLAGRKDRFDLLHIGSHFTLRPGEVGRSWLMLGNGEHLPLNELLGWQFESQDLVTLSACQTGIGGGGEVDGLAGLLLRRGAAGVVASLWPVEDQSTSALIRQMYQALGKGAEPAAALRQAQLQSLHSGSARQAHPHAWAGFYFAGAAIAP